MSHIPRSHHHMDLELGKDLSMLRKGRLSHTDWTSHTGSASCTVPTHIALVRHSGSLLRMGHSVRRTYLGKFIREVVLCGGRRSLARPTNWLEAFSVSCGSGNKAVIALLSNRNSETDI